jgi:hypothetical protein
MEYGMTKVDSAIHKIDVMIYIIFNSPEEFY